MPVVEITDYIQAPPQMVWDLICDIKRGPEWVTVMKEVIHTSDDMASLGTVYRERSKVGPALSETEWKVTRFETPNLQVHETREQAMHAVLTMRVQPEAGGARVLHRTEFRMVPKFRPLGWLLEKLFAERTLSREMRQTVSNLKALAEREAKAH